MVGSLSAHDRQEPVSRPEGVSEDEHAAHHGGGKSTELEAGSTGLLYLVNTATKTIDRKLEVPGPVHHVLVTPTVAMPFPRILLVAVSALWIWIPVSWSKLWRRGPAPNYLVQDDGQSLLVSNTGNGTVSEVDTEHWFVERNLRVGGNPEHMVLAPGNQRLYVNDAASGQVLVLELAKGAVANRYEVGEAPHGVGLSADGQTLYATSQGGNQVVRD